jgi:hypothetical protein
MLSLVPTGVRGSDAAPVGRNSRNLRSFVIPHLPQRDTVLADAIQNVRTFGSESELQTVQAIVSARQSAMRANLDVTIEHHRMGAIKGLVLDSDGTTLFDLFAEFGVSQSTHAMDFSNQTDINTNILKAKRKSEDALGGTTFGGFRVFCSKGFMDAMLEHKDFKNAFNLWNNGEALRTDNRSGFPYSGVIFEEYRGKAGNTEFIAEGEAYLVPEGVTGLFITRFAPADYMETVNTVGIPYYSKQEPMRFNKGIELEAQSNPINLCTRPNAVVKLTA